MAFSKEFIQLNIDYARKQSQETGNKLADVLITQTCIPRSVLGISFNQDISGPAWEKFLESLNGDPAQTAFRLQTIKTQESRIRSGRISLTYPVNGLSLVHFSTDITEAHPFDKDGINRRISEFKDTLSTLSAYSPSFIGMFSWLLDTRFKDFFPDDAEMLPNPNKFYSSLAVWGQYLRYDGSLNQKRVEELLQTGNHPKIAYQARVPAFKMYQLYL